MASLSREIQIAHGRGTVVIDESDFETLSQYKWRLCSRYAQAGINGRPTLMHRFLMGLGELDRRQVDHINGNGLDNRRQNLRIATRSQNCAHIGVPKHNTSGFKGVHWDRNGRKWRARIYVSKKPISLGMFLSIHDAARAYDAAARLYFGEFSVTNFKE